jgi:hypothetical protein
MNKQINLTKNLEKLNEIANWFDQQTQVDVEEGLKKVKEAAILIKESKARLREVENEFVEIQAAILDEDSERTVTVETITVEKTTAETLSEKDIPF